MKRFLTALCLSGLVLLPSVRADGPDDDYVAIYNLIQQGDALNEKGELGEAVTKYTEAENALKRFQAHYPDSYVKVVKYRLTYLQDKLTQLSSKGATPAGSTNGPSQSPTNAPATSAAPSAELENQVKGLQEQVHRLEADRSLLEAKLKEALAARPPELDPQELAKAQAQITSLQKENELLKASVEKSKTNSAAAADNSANLEKAQQALAEANRKLAALAEANSTLLLEKDALQARVKAPPTTDSATEALRQENEILKKQVAQLQTQASATPATTPSGVQHQLQEAQAKIAALQSDMEVLRLEKMTLENRVKQFSANAGATNTTPATASAPVATTTTTTNAAPDTMMDSVTASKIAQLEAQRDELQKSLDTATRDAYGHKRGKVMAERIDEMTRQLASLRARLQVLEATPVPYSVEEQALFSPPAMALNASTHSGSHKKPKPLPAAAEMLLNEGKRYYVAHEFDKAEAKYIEALKYDSKSVGILSDLASIQLESGKLDEAEKNIKAALAQEPDDDYSLFVLGQLKFRQKNYDEAFTALSHAAEINPQNARIQNFLGLTLSEKGLRGPAETAFRKAIQVDPGYADAHINLAVVYATQQPPLTELARWHYQKALATGHAPNPSLEKMLEQAQSAAR